MGREFGRKAGNGPQTFIMTCDTSGSGYVFRAAFEFFP